MQNSCENELNLLYNINYINKEVEVLVEEKIENYYVGHTTNFIKVKILSDVSLNKNDVVKVFVTEAFDSYVIANYKGE